MKFVDAHVHLSHEEYAEDIDEIISEAKNSGVVALVSNSVNHETSIGNLRLAERYPGMVYVALGIHPGKAGDMREDENQQMVELISQHKQNKALVAIGEIGLDYKYKKSWDEQMKVFDGMINLAEKIDLAVIIHSRGTTGKIVDMLSSYNLERVLLHWFSGSISLLNKVVDRGYYITEGAPAAYSKHIREIISRIPLTSLLTETDGPVRFKKNPFNGRRTTPVFIPTVVEAVAEIKNREVTEVAAQIIENFETFFGVKLN